MTVSWRLTPEQKDEIFARAEAGEGVTALGREFGVRHGAIQGIVACRRRGMVLRRWERTLFLPEDAVTVSYIAGLIDGEGSIYQRSQDGNWYFKLAMTDGPVVRWLASFGGTFSVEKRPEGRKTAYSWNVSRRVDLAALLLETLPYLRVKRDVALQALTTLEE